jgi:hypothetical protein
MTVKKKSNIIQAYREYFPDIAKVCELNNIERDSLMDELANDREFKILMERIRLSYLLEIDNVLFGIIRDNEASSDQRIKACGVILRHKKELKEII